MDSTPPTIGHNSLAAAEESSKLPEFLHEAQELVQIVDEWIDAVPEIERSDDAERARDFLGKLTAREKQIEDARKAEKQPFLDAGRSVDDKWREPASLIAACKAPIQKLLKGWLDKEKARLKAEEAAQRAEALRLAKEAEEAARKAAEERAGVSAAIVAEQAAKRAAEASAAAHKAASARPQVASASGGARRVSIRETWRAEVSDFGRAVKHYWNSPELVAALERLASADARKGAREIPGFIVYSEEKVA